MIEGAGERLSLQGVAVLDYVVPVRPRRFQSSVALQEKNGAWWMVWRLKRKFADEFSVSDRDAWPSLYYLILSYFLCCEYFSFVMIPFVLIPSSWRFCPCEKAFEWFIIERGCWPIPWRTWMRARVYKHIRRRFGRASLRPLQLRQCVIWVQLRWSSGTIQYCEEQWKGSVRAHGCVSQSAELADTKRSSRETPM